MLILSSAHFYIIACHDSHTRKYKKNSCHDLESTGQPLDKWSKVNIIFYQMEIWWVIWILWFDFSCMVEIEVDNVCNKTLRRTIMKTQKVDRSV